MAAFAVVGFLALLAVVVVIPVWATDTPSYCMSCKATKAAGEEWRTSVHSKVSCTTCHVPPGVVNGIKWRTREWLNIWADYLNVPQVANVGQVPSNASCLQCHSLASIPGQIGDIRFPHEQHVNLRNLTCADCHGQAMHPTSGTAATASTMATCSMCHNTEGAPSSCSFCHVTPPPKNVHPKNWIKVHGVQASADEQACLQCHHSKAEFCDACHAKPPVAHFSGTWEYTHGASATKDPLSCTGCHTKSFCAQCHTVDHPADWISTHSAVAARSGTACLVCHAQATCDACHKQQGVSP